MIRDDSGQLLETPYAVSMITAPAVNAGALRQGEPDQAEEIGLVLRRRAGYALAVARENGGVACSRKIRKKWPLFLQSRCWIMGRWRGGGTVVFAIPDRSDDQVMIDRFRERFGAG